jgi:hypothetical protein
MADLEQLSVTLSARIDDFKRGMQEAVREFDRDAGQIDQRNQQLAQSMSRSMQDGAASAKFLANALKQLLSVYAVQQFISAIKQANQALTDLARLSEDTRISSQNIVGLHLAGAGQGAGTKEVDAALQHFTAQSKKTEEDAKGLYTALRQVDPALATAFKSAPTQTERLNIISRALGLAQNETKRYQVAVNALGTDNDRVIRTFQDAGGNIQTMGQKARAAGIEIDDGLTKKAAEAQKQLDLLSEVSGDKLKVAFASLAPVLIYALNFMSKIGTAMGLIYDTAVRMGNLGGRADEVAHVQRPYIVSPDGTKHYDEFAPNGLPFEGGPLPPRRPTGTGGSGGEPAFGGRANLNKSESEKDDAFDREIKRLEKSKIALEGQAAAQGLAGKAAAEAEASARLFEAAEEAGIPRTTALELQVRKLAEAYAEVKAKVAEAKLEQDLIFQRAQLGRSSDEQAIYSDLRGRGVEATERNVQEMQNLRNLTDAKEGANSFIKGMISDMENGVRAGKALENQLKRILEKLSDKALDKLISGAFGGIGGLFGGGGSYGASDFTAAEAGAATGAFGPGFASGGLVGRDGKPTWIPASALRGARQFAIGGGVPAILHAGEIVLNQAQQKNVAQSMSGGPRGPINLTHAPVINGTGLSKEEVFSVIQRSQKEFSRQIGPIFSDWQRRYG